MSALNHMKGAVLIVALSGMPAVAGTICDDLITMANGDQSPLMLSDQPAECRQSRGLSGERHIHCNWGFAYRSTAATSAFETLTSDLSACLGPDAVETADQIVNHPDAYDLRQFVLDGRAFAVSIKDKGALQQTLVFVRVEILP